MLHFTEYNGKLSAIDADTAIVSIKKEKVHCHPFNKELFSIGDEVIVKVGGVNMGKGVYTGTIIRKV